MRAWIMAGMVLGCAVALPAQAASYLVHIVAQKVEGTQGGVIAEYTGFQTTGQVAAIRMSSSHTIRPQCVNAPLAPPPLPMPAPEFRFTEGPKIAPTESGPRVPSVEPPSRADCGLSAIETLSGTLTIGAPVAKAQWSQPTVPEVAISVDLSGKRDTFNQPNQAVAVKRTLNVAVGHPVVMGTTGEKGETIMYVLTVQPQ